MDQEIRIPCELKFGTPPAQDVAAEDYVHRLHQIMNDMHHRVRLNVQVTSDRIKEAKDSKRATEDSIPTQYPRTENTPCRNS